MTSIRTLANALATAMLATSWEEPEIVRSAVKLFGKRWPWLAALSKRALAQFSQKPSHRLLTSFIQQDSALFKAYYQLQLNIKQWPLEQLKFSPLPFATDLKLPPLTTVEELADWLGVEIRQLEWFADHRCLCGKANSQRLTHYHYRTLSKRFGAIRLIEAPKPRIKSLQRQILDGILSLVPTHPAAQGFRRGASICTFAAPHINQQLVLKLDLRDFFPSISYAQIEAVFRALGYPECVAQSLAGICTNAVSADAWKSLRQPLDSTVIAEKLLDAVRRYEKPHLPQGSPSSPALANLCAYGLDCRLTGLANSAGAVYTRYADDLAFSGPDLFRRSVRRFYYQASAIGMDEGFRVNFHKTRIMPRAVKQQLAGLVINSHLNIPRRDFDELKAILTNCFRYGVESQNRTGERDFRRHLLGRISYMAMVNPARGEKLKTLFARIEW